MPDTGTHEHDGPGHTEPMELARIGFVGLAIVVAWLRLFRIIMTNFAGTLAVETAGVALAAFGYLNPVLAALIHVTSELVFILNSARLLSGATTAPPVYAGERQPLAGTSSRDRAYAYGRG
jgi:hypothetical protein